METNIFDVLTNFFFLYAIAAVVVIILERRKPEKTISWLLIFAVIPYVAFFIYGFFGKNWKKHKLNNEMDIVVYKYFENLLEKDNFSNNYKYKSIVNLVKKSCNSPLFENNSVEIFKTGEEKYTNLFKDLKNAKKNIYIEYYLVRNDNTGHIFRDILLKKAKEGVEIKLILDKVGSAELTKYFFEPLKKAGVEVLFYNYFLYPIFKLINFQINYRNHRKIVIIDKKIVYYGGMNIGNEYASKSRLGYWRDVHIKSQGEVVSGFLAVFYDDYNTLRKASKLPIKIHSLEDYKTSLPSNNYSKKLQIVISGPNSKNQTIMQTISAMISLAKKNIIICSPYFVPNELIMEQLKIAIMSGIKLKILFPTAVDHYLVHYASNTYLAELLKYGAEIYFYPKNKFVHAKYVCIDSEICNVGTTNMDIRSFALNYEINTIIYDSSTTKEIEKIFYQDIFNSYKLPKNYFTDKNFFIKF